MFENFQKVYSTAVAGIKRVEGRVLSQETNASGKRVVANTNLQPSKRQYVDISWLKGASESYDISPNIEDYVIVPVPIITTDVPNRNMQAWPYSEITYFDPIHGKFVYQTFTGKPTHIDHKNDNPKEAKGVILDASLHFVPKYEVGKIVVLTAWDRSKDPHLVRQILKRERDSYSMGCYVSQFVCGVCGTPYGRERPACQHQMNPHMPVVQMINGSLNYMNCLGCTFFECSSVGSPADVTAFSDELLSLSI